MSVIKKGDIVEWLGSHYIVEEVVNKKVLLKQNFSMGVVLSSMVDIDDVNKVQKLLNYKTLKFFNVFFVLSKYLSYISNQTQYDG